MNTPSLPRVGYVMKVYPRFSQTFVVNEILAHEAAGQPLSIFSLRRTDDPRFHHTLAKVRSPVTYLSRRSSSAGGLFDLLRTTLRELNDVEDLLRRPDAIAQGEFEQAARLALEIKRQDIQHLHAHFGTIATTVSKLAARMAGISYSFTAHAKDIFHESVDPETLRTKLDAAAAVVTVSDFNVRFLKEHYGLAAERVQRIYNGLDLQDYAFAPADQRVPLILGVGRLVEKKGFEYLIQACGILARRGVTFRCEIVGTGVLEESLAQAVAAAGLGEQIRLLGPLPQHEVRQKLAQAQVLAAPCVVSGDADKDGLPTILLEAMAMGTPCVSTDVTGIPEAVQHGQTGLVVTQRDAVTLADACASLLSDAGLGQRLACNARQLVERRFDVQRSARLLQDVFARSVAACPNPQQRPATSAQSC